MIGSEKPSSETQIFSASVSSKRKMKFIPWVFLGYILLMSWGDWWLYQKVGVTPRFIVCSVSLAFTFFVFSYVTFFGFKMRQRQFEFSSGGITLVEGNGKKKAVPWDEMGSLKEPMGGGALTIFDQTGKKCFIVPPVIDGFDRLKKQIYDRFDKRNPLAKAGLKTDVLVYPMHPSAGTTFLVGGIFFLLFFVGSVVAIIGSIQDQHSKIAHPMVMWVVLGFGSLFWLALAVYALVWGSQISKSKIEISSGGIARLEKDGSRVFIRWDDVARLTKRERMKQIGVYSVSDTKKIMVDYQFERFEQIRDRIFDEFEKRLKLPSMPITYGRLPAFPNLFVFLLFAAFIGLILLAWSHDTKNQTLAFLFIEIFLIGFYLLNLYAESRLVKAMTLDSQELTLNRVFGKIILPWDKLDRIEQQSTATQNGKYYSVKLTTNDGKSYPFDNSLVSRLEVFMTLKKYLDMRNART